MTDGVVGLHRTELSLGRKLKNIPWLLVLIILLVAAIGFATLYSVANGVTDTWVMRQLVRFALALILMFFVALVDIRLWHRFAYVIYVAAFILLIAVEVVGRTEQGAQRWIDLGVFQLQPSEIMKIALVLALARYFHGLSLDQVGRLPWLIVPTAMILAPAALVLRQPDLGTALLLVLGGMAILYLAGVRMWTFGAVLLAGVVSIPIGWQYLHAYQRDRLLTFLDPERDALGAGYHIIQSKIALGSGAVFGKGFMQGTQSHLNFLPEKQTDFVFTVFAEEFGLIGGLVLLALYIVLLVYALVVAVRVRNQFGRLVAMGAGATFFIYVFINIAMVMGLIPVVGVPLPLISYGGTAMVTILVGFGFIISAHIHRDIPIARRLPHLEG